LEDNDTNICSLARNRREQEIIKDKTPNLLSWDIVAENRISFKCCFRLKMSKEIREVTKLSRYATPPPPIVIRRDQAGSTTDYGYPSFIKAVEWYRQSPRIVMEGTSVENNSFKLKNKDVLMLLESQNYRGLNIFNYAHSLKNIDELSWTFSSAVKFLEMIAKEDIDYPEGILEKLRNLVKQDLSQIDPNDIFDMASSALWLKYLTLERSRLIPVLESITGIDLYLIPPNYYDRFPARRLLSYYTDNELYEKFYIVNDVSFPTGFKNKLEQLDGLVALSLSRGYFTIQTYSDPILLNFNIPRFPISDLNDIDRKEVNLSEMISYLKMGKIQKQMLLPILRLWIQIRASWPQLHEKDTWIQLGNIIYDNRYDIVNEYMYEKNKKPIAVTTASLPPELNSYEEDINICVLCHKPRPSGDFGLCGHGVCSVCQAESGSIKCPLGNEFFVSSNMNDKFIESIGEMKKEFDTPEGKNNRRYRFDWSNNNISIFNPDDLLRGFI